MARRGRSGRGGLVLLVVVVVLAVLAVVADRVAQQVAEGRVAKQLQAQLGTPAAPSVDIAGFPFLTQAARRSFSSVHVVGDEVRPPNSTTTVKHVDLRLSGVTSDDNFKTSTAQRVSGTATLDYPTVKKLTGQSLKYAPPGRVSVSSPTSLMGMPVTATVVGRPAVDVARQTLTLAEPQLSVAGMQVPDTAAQALLASVAKPAPLRDVPFGLKVRDVQAEPDGLVAGLTGGPATFR